MGPPHLQAGVEQVLKCRTDECYPAPRLLWRVGGVLQEEGVTHTTEYTEGGAVEAWSDIIITLDDEDDEVTVTCEVEGHESELRDEKNFKVKGICWKVLLRENSEEEFSVPEGFQFVELNNEDIKDYFPLLNNLITEEVTVQLKAKLASFAKSEVEENCIFEDGKYFNTF